MKLFKTESPFLEKHEWRKLFLATSIMVLVLYVVAMVFSLCGSDIFIVKYQNDQMDRIENFMTQHKIMPLIIFIFTTLEFTIITAFVLNKRPKIYYILPFYAIAMIISATMPFIPSTFYSLYTIICYFIVPLIDQLICTHKISGKLYLKQFLRCLIATFVDFIIQLMIFVIKAGYFSVDNHIMTISAHFIYSIELDIALSVFLATITLYIDKGKGDSKSWATYQDQSGFSQISKTKSQRLSWKNLTKKQKNKLVWLYVRLYLIQILGFSIIMILPFLTGKVLEFLIIYLAFAVVRYILGFKYSLHFKSETLCISVGAVVFGILTLAVPFFYVDLIIAVLLGSGLAIFLHLSYKYRGFWLFVKMAKPDKFAALYVIFEGDLSERYILRTCKYKGLSVTDSCLVLDYMNCEKLSYLSYKYNYSVKTLDRKLTDAIDILNK